MLRLCRLFPPPGAVCALLTIAALGLTVSRARAQAPEFRAFWVDAFHAGFKNSSQVTTLVDSIRKANCNAAVVELRKRGDAYYTPNTSYPDYEPHATDTSPANFDSLADLIAKAHDTSGGKARIEVHVWLVTWPIWGSSTSFPTDPQHPYNRHPEWLTQDNTGATWNGSQYCFDPGHPGAAGHTFRIAMNLVTNYDIDGINFDYVRYADRTWGYNPTAVSRFHAQYGGSGNPANTDPSWLQFRRDQVTAFVRKTYLNTVAVKPNVKVSADTITWSPGPVNLAAWYSSSAAWNSVLQDWRGWMQEGILDLNIPMAYFDQSGLYTQAWTNWCNFIRDSQYNRQAAIGPGVYLNATADAITQIRYTRAASGLGNTVRGVCGYSYAVPDKNGTPFATFLQYLTNAPNAYDAVSPAVFATAVPVPAMPWKTAPGTGHLMGTVFGGSPVAALDGAVVTLSGPVSRSQTNDGSGFYGFVDLPPGSYTVRATMSGMGAATNAVSISAGSVKISNLVISTNDTTPPVISGVYATNISDAFATAVWSTDENADSIVEYGTTLSYGSAVTNSSLQTTHSVPLNSLNPGTTYHYRVKSRDAAGNVAISPDFTFTTNPPGTVSDLIIDNPAAAVTGSWSTGNSAVDRFGADYRYKSQGTGSAYLQFTPNILTAGTYQVFEWHSVGGNRTTNAPHVISSNGRSDTVFVNQKVAGGQWNLLGAWSFAAGTAAWIRITDGFSDGTQVVIADAIKLVYVPPLIAPQIASQPQDQLVKATSNAVFSVTAGGTQPLKYQWQKDGSSLSGATTNSLTVLGVQASSAGTYRVVITNVAGAVTSAPALLSVVPLEPPLITEAPRSQAAVPGGSATFFVAADSPSRLRYQWQFNGKDLTGQASDTISLSNLQPADFGSYAVRLSNDDGSVVSDPAELTVAVAPALRPALAGSQTLTLSFPTEPGPLYLLEFTDAESAAWQSLTNVPGTGTWVTATDSITQTNLARFYRVQVR